MSSLAYMQQLNKNCSDICLEAIVKNRWKAIHFFLSYDVYSAVKRFPSFEGKDMDEGIPIHNGPSPLLGKWSGVPVYLCWGHDVMILVSVD